MRYSIKMSSKRCAQSGNPGGCPASNVSGFRASKAITSGSSGSRGAFPYLPRYEKASMSWRVNLISSPFWSDRGQKPRPLPLVVAGLIPISAKLSESRVALPLAASGEREQKDASRQVFHRKRNAARPELIFEILNPLIFQDHPHDVASARPEERTNDPLF